MKLRDGTKLNDKLKALLKKTKNMLGKPAFFLILIAVLVFSVRIYIAFQTPLMNHEAYFGLRQIQSIRDTGLPLYTDPLSYGGKIQLFAPLQYYVMTLFSYFMPIEYTGKIVPNIFAALIVFIVYSISLKITKSNKISLWTALISGFIPILFVDLNRASVNYMAIILILSIIYCMMKLNERKYVDYSLTLMFLLVLTTPLAFILVIGMLMYLILLKLENYGIEMKELEIILFFTFLTFWVNLLIYKNAFLMHGMKVVWQNMPTSIISEFFAKIGFIQVLGAVSVIPLVLGVYAFYAALHKDRNKDLMILIASGISIFLLIWFKLVSLIVGMTFLSIIMVIMTAYSLKRIDDFIDKSKLQKYYKLFQAIFAVLVIITVIPSLISIINSEDIGPLNTPKISDVKAMMWASENTPRLTVIMSSIDEGNMVAYYANRKNVMDTNFLLTPRIDQIKLDVDEVYKTNFETKAIGILNKYNAKYLLVTERTLNEYGINYPAYLEDKKCFIPAYFSEGTYLYRIDCKIV
jgi:hypothetical protein